MKQIRIGIFGVFRGCIGFFDNILANNGEIVAICDKNEDRLQRAAKQLGGTAATYTDFDAFIEHPMDAVLLANYFNEHAEYAIRCLQKDLHVLSECLTNATMADGVALVRAAEQSKGLYMLAENYPFMTFNREMKRIYAGGTLGKALYAEGEYNHAADIYSDNIDGFLIDSTTHWRLFNARTYYITHSLAPLVYATGALPVRVTAMPVYHPLPTDCNNGSRCGDRAAIITTLNDDNSVFKVTGCADFGASDNSYRICCEKGQIENLRGSGGKIMLRYNAWQVPKGKEAVNYYTPEMNDPDAALIQKAGHDGGDFFVIREFFDCIRQNKQPEMDVYFGTRLASVAILAHRSLLEFGLPYDIPDFRKETDRKQWENDRLTPFWHSDGTPPSQPCCSHPDYTPSKQQQKNLEEKLERAKKAGFPS